MLFGINTEEEHHVLKNVKDCTLDKYCWGGQIKGYKTGMVCSTHGNIDKRYRSVKTGPVVRRNL
jgi:hypothetical protein